MLTTDKGHEVPSFPSHIGSGVTAWRVVTLDFKIPYIFISYAFKEDRSWLSQTSIFWQHKDVIDFCKDVKSDKSRKILDIFLLLPPMKKSAVSWSLAVVKEIFTGKYEDTNVEFPLYVTVNGDKIGGPGNLESHEKYDALEKFSLQRSAKVNLNKQVDCSIGTSAEPDTCGTF